MTTDFSTVPSANGLNGPSAPVTVETSTHASHTEILTPPPRLEQAAHALALFTNTQQRDLGLATVDQHLVRHDHRNVVINYRNLMEIAKNIKIT